MEIGKVGPGVQFWKPAVTDPALGWLIDVLGKCDRFSMRSP
jgi:hypothetical protein